MITVGEFQSSVVRRVGVAVVCAKIVLMPLVFHQAFDWPFTVPKALLSHALAYLLAGILVGLFARHGRAIVVRSWLHAPVLGFVAVSVLSAVFAAETELALYGTHARMLGLNAVLDGAISYLAIVHLVRTPLEARLAIAACLAAAGPVLAYEAVQLRGADPLHWDGDTTVRPISTLGQATTLAQYLITLGMGCAAMAVVSRLRAAVRVLVLACAALLVLGASATLTRSIVFGMVAGVAAMVVIVWVRHPARRARWAAAAIAFAAVIAASAFIVATPLGGRLATVIVSSGSSGGPDDRTIERLEPSINARLVLYEIAARMTIERPLLGYGPDNFAPGIPRHRPPGAEPGIRESVATSAHGWPAQTAATTGLLGLACFLAIPIVAIVLTFRSPYDPSLAAMITALSAFLASGATTVTDVSTEWLFWSAIGGVAVMTARTTAPSTPPPPGRRAKRARTREPRDLPIRRVGLAVSVAIGAGLCLAPLNAANASRLSEASQQLRLQRLGSEAVEAATRATALDPGRPEYWHTLGLAYVARGSLREASAAFHRASSIAPYDIRYVRDQVSAELLLVGAGDRSRVPRALALADTAVQVDPNNPRAHLTRAIAHQATGDLVAARTSAEKALTLDPGSRNPQLYVVAMQTMRGTGQLAAAATVGRAAVAELDLRESVPVRIEFARVLALSQLIAEAIAELDQVLRIAPNERTALQLRAELSAPR